MLDYYQPIAEHFARHRPELAWIDLDRGQLDNPTAFDALLMPALLIGIPTIEWEPLGNHAEQGQAELVLTTVFRLPFHTNFVDPNLRAYVQQLALADLVHQTLRGLDHGITRQRQQTRTTDAFFAIEQTYTFMVHLDGKPYLTKTVPVQTTVELTHQPAKK